MFPNLYQQLKKCSPNLMHFSLYYLKLIFVNIYVLASFVAYKPNPDDYGPPLPPWLRIYLGLNYVFKEDVDLVHVVVGTKFVTEPNFEKAKRAAKVRFIYFHKL